MKPCFLPADVLMPQVDDLPSWAVVACDQYSSQPEYWDRVWEDVKDKPSTLHLILPEAWLNTDKEKAHEARIPGMMQAYLENGLFMDHPDAYIYVERTLSSGVVRKGLIGMVDLEAYDFSQGSVSPVRATEATIIDRIPPRVAIREKACLELPHVLLLADDAQDSLLGPLQAARDEMEMLYDFELMENGGHLQGWLVSDAQKDAFLERQQAFADGIHQRYPGLEEDSLCFAVGDGNHSLATAKTIWENLKPSLSEEEQKTHPARFALAELENIHDDAQQFEPIHRIITGTDPQQLLQDLLPLTVPEGEDGFVLQWQTAEDHGTLVLDPARGELATAILQNFLDDWLKEHPGEIDYIHGEDEVRSLARQEQAIGFLLPPFAKSSLFRGVIADGSLPRKTFSMGHAQEKRFYLEARRIRREN